MTLIEKIISIMIIVIIVQDLATFSAMEDYKPDQESSEHVEEHQAEHNFESGESI